MVNEYESGGRRMSYIITFKGEKRAFSIKINEANNEVEAIDKARKFLVDVKKRTENFVHNFIIVSKEEKHHGSTDYRKERQRKNKISSG